MEYQRVTKAAQKGQPQTPSSSLRQTSLNHVAVHPLLGLQRSIGNQAVLNLLHSQNMHMDASTPAFRAPRFSYDFSRIPLHSTQTAALQTKLQVNQPGDIHEQEADRVAEQVMRMTDSERSPSDEEDEAKDSLMRKQTNGSGAHGATDTSSAPPIVHKVLNSSGGQPLDATTRAFMESRFEHDFSQVRIHTDERAADSARAVNALAYTVGRDMVFGAGRYSPETSEGKRLIAHELAHVVQQSANDIPLVLGYSFIQRAPAPHPNPVTKLRLPWTHGIITLFEVTDSGIHFLIGFNNRQRSEKAIRAMIPSLAKQIASSNTLIKDAAYQIRTCYMVPTDTRFALFNDTPVLMVDTLLTNPSPSLIAHEMGHAVFHYLASRGKSDTPDASRSENFRLRIAAVYLKLKDTDLITLEVPSQSLEGPIRKKLTHPAGLWMVDHSQWKPGSVIEHPWDDPEELFASAKEAFQMDEAALRKTIAHFTKIDSKVGAPAKELLDLLHAFLGKGKLPEVGLPEGAKTKAETELKGLDQRVNKIEETMRSNNYLKWLLNPDERPEP